MSASGGSAAVSSRAATRPRKSNAVVKKEVVIYLRLLVVLIGAVDVVSDWLYAATVLWSDGNCDEGRPPATSEITSDSGSDSTTGLQTRNFAMASFVFCVFGTIWFWFELTFWHKYYFTPNKMSNRQRLSSLASASVTGSAGVALPRRASSASPQSQGGTRAPARASTFDSRHPLDLSRSSDRQHVELSQATIAAPAMRAEQGESNNVAVATAKGVTGGVGVVSQSTDGGALDSTAGVSSPSHSQSREQLLGTEDPAADSPADPVEEHIIDAEDLSDEEYDEDVTAADESWSDAEEEENDMEEAPAAVEQHILDGADNAMNSSGGADHDVGGLRVVDTAPMAVQGVVEPEDTEKKKTHAGAARANTLSADFKARTFRTKRQRSKRTGRFRDMPNLLPRVFYNIGWADAIAYAAMLVVFVSGFSGTMILLAGAWWFTASIATGSLLGLIMGDRPFVRDTARKKRRHLLGRLLTEDLPQAIIQIYIGFLLGSFSGTVSSNPVAVISLFLTFLSLSMNLTVWLLLSFRSRIDKRGELLPTCGCCCAMPLLWAVNFGVGVLLVIMLQGYPRGIVFGVDVERVSLVSGIVGTSEYPSGSACVDASALTVDMRLLLLDSTGTAPPLRWTAESDLEMTLSLPFPADGGVSVWQNLSSPALAGSSQGHNVSVVITLLRGSRDILFPSSKMQWRSTSGQQWSSSGDYSGEWDVQPPTSEGIWDNVSHRVVPAASDPSSDFTARYFLQDFCSFSTRNGSTSSCVQTQPPLLASRVPSLCGAVPFNSSAARVFWLEVTTTKMPVVRCYRRSETAVD